MKPWQQFLTNLANLIKVKTLITFVVMFTFCVLTIRSGELSGEFVMIATAVITYYFTRDEHKKHED
jgi:hypothetical protein